MSVSLFSFVRNGLSQGYPIVEAIYNLLPLASEVVLVDCGSTDGTKELLEALAAVNPHVVVYHESWQDGLGGRNYNKSSNLCHQLCSNDMILFAEADEVWEETLVEHTKGLLRSGFDNLKFWRFQLTQNFQRSPWYLEQAQVLPRLFRKGSCQIIEGNTNSVNSAFEVPLDFGYIVDCRNNFRDSYLSVKKRLMLYGVTRQEKQFV